MIEIRDQIESQQLEIVDEASRNQRLFWISPKGNVIYVPYYNSTFDRYHIYDIIMRPSVYGLSDNDFRSKYNLPLKDDLLKLLSNPDGDLITFSKVHQICGDLYNSLLLDKWVKGIIHQNMVLELHLSSKYLSDRKLYDNIITGLLDLGVNQDEYINIYAILPSRAYRKYTTSLRDMIQHNTLLSIR